MAALYNGADISRAIIRARLLFGLGRRVEAASIGQNDSPMRVAVLAVVGGARASINANIAVAARRVANVVFRGRFRVNSRHQADAPKWSKMTHCVISAGLNAVPQSIANVIM